MASVTVKMLDGHLQTIWNGMKTAMLAGDVSQVVNYFDEETKSNYLEIFDTILAQLPQLAADMREIEPVYFEDGGAQFRIKRHEVIQGSEYDMTYYIYFQKDENGIWKIFRF